MYSVDQLPDRMLGKVEVTEAGCWQWRMSLNGVGYGQTWDGEKVRTAHRCAYLHIVGEIPTGLVLDHLCRNRGCCNPAHLEPVTQRENLLRAGILDPRPLRTECPKHGPGNMREQRCTDRARGVRVLCRSCANERQNARAARLRAARKMGG